MKSIENMLHTLSSKLDNSEQLLVPFLVKKAENYLQSNAHDKTVGVMNVALNKMLDNNKGFISKAAFKDLYNKSYSYGTKASNLFSDELNLVEVKETVKQASYYEKDVEAFGGDSVLKTALADAFEKREIREYSEDLANKAMKMIKAELSIWGLSPKNMSVNSGNNKVLLIQAEYDTPKGVTAVVIPVALNDEKIVESGMFLGNSSPQELSYNNLRNYIKTNAGVKLAFNSNILLNALTTKLAGDDNISATEMALIRLKSKKNAASAFEQNSIIGQELDSLPMKDIQEERFAGADLFEAKLATAYGEAVFKFGSSVVTDCRNLLLRKLAGLGFVGSQIKLASFNEDSLQYAVDLGSVAFTTKVKIKNHLIQDPTYIVSNGSLHEFSKESLNKLVSESYDIKASAVASPLFESNAGELISVVEAAVKDKNLVKAEDALNVLLNQNNHVAYAKAFNIYLNALNNKVAVQEHKCSKMIKNATSNEMICSHTGLPLSKVAYDKHGQCIPLYRKHMNDTFDGVISLTSKVFV